jgi:hypothetical protein
MKAKQMMNNQTNRTEQEIFEALGALCMSPGYVHVIAYFCMRDNLIQYSGDDITPEDMGKLYGDQRLIRTEITALQGLLIKHEIDYAIPPLEIFQQYVAKSEALLKELHNAIGTVPLAGSTHPLQDRDSDPLSSGAVLREAIFYGGESAYSFQYRDFASLKYDRDDQWLIANKGYSIHDGRKVVRAVGLLQNQKATENYVMLRKSLPEQHTYLPGNEFTCAEVAECACLPLDVVERILTVFTLPENERNADYHALQVYNAVSAFPLMRQGSSYFLFNIYCLTEAFYQSPFYWMWDDKRYQAKAMTNRGKFTEEFSAKRLSCVFGDANVHSGVNIFTSKYTVAGEIDVLVLFGDRAIILQAKSKQLTIHARQGNDEKLKADFEAAIQESCNQGYSCARLLLDGKTSLKTADGVDIFRPANIKNVYVICVIADHYPALSHQTTQFLKFDALDRVSPPFVMDVFLLDTMAEMLATPLYFLSYVERRTKYHDKFMSNHELNILAYHLLLNLWTDNEYNLIMLDDSIGTALELSMLVRRENFPGPSTPDGILTRMAGTALGRLIKQIEREHNPAMLALGLMILTLSETAVADISKFIDEYTRRARADQKLHDASMSMQGDKSGLTIHFNLDNSDVARNKLMAHCMMRKYADKADSWFGICIFPNNGSIIFGVHLESKWGRDSEMDEMTKSMVQPRKFDGTTFREAVKRGKVGRNDPCPCGSGKKNKKCCFY